VIFDRQIITVKTAKLCALLIHILWILNQADVFINACICRYQKILVFKFKHKIR